MKRNATNENFILFQYIFNGICFVFVVCFYNRCFNGNNWKS